MGRTRDCRSLGRAPRVPAYLWGDIASDFRWNLKSRPLTKVLGMGAEAKATSLARISPRTLRQAQMEVAVSAPSGPVVGRPAAINSASTLDLGSIKLEQRADLLADLYLAAREASDTPLSAGDTARVPPAASETAGSTVGCFWRLRPRSSLNCFTVSTRGSAGLPPLVPTSGSTELARSRNVPSRPLATSFQASSRRPGQRSTPSWPTSLETS